MIRGFFGKCSFYKTLDSIERVFNVALDCFSLPKLQPTTMGTNLGQNLMPFDRCSKKTRKVGLSNLTRFSLFAMPDYLEDTLQGFLAYFAVDKDVHMRYATISVRDNLVPDSLFDQMCLAVAQVVHPDYGHREVYPGCGLYEVGRGIEFHGDVYYFAGFIQKLFLFGDRLVFWNILNSYHVNRRIGEGTLADWVGADPSRGVLEPYVEGTWLWKIPKEKTAELMKPLADADILFDAHKHFYPWVHTFAARVNRGDLTRQDVIRLLLEHVREHGRVPTPPHRAQASPNHFFVTDEVAVTRWLKEWGHPAASLPEPPPPSGPVTSEQTQEVVGNILGGLGYTPDNAKIVRVQDSKPHKVSDAEAAKLLSKHKPRKRGK